MPRPYLPLVPVVALAAVVAINAACSRGEREEGDGLRVVPPPAAYRPAPAPLLAAASEAVHPAAAPAADPEPSADEVKAFEGPVRK
jgi:hypothetical protein